MNIVFLANHSLFLFAQEQEFVLSGSLVDGEGKPAEGAVVAICRYIEDISTGTLTTTDRDGKFSVTVVATPDTVDAMHFECESAGGAEIGYFALRPGNSKPDLQSIPLRLSPTKKARMLVIDAEENPVAGANAVAQLSGLDGRKLSTTTNEAGIAEITYTDLEPVAIAFAWKDKLGIEYRLFKPQQSGVGPDFQPDNPERFKLDGAWPVKLRFVDDQQRPLEGIEVCPWILRKAVRTSLRSSDLNLSLFRRLVQKHTDANGEVSFDWLPAWQKGGFNFVSSGGTDIVHTQILVDPATLQGVKEIQLSRKVPIRGTVVGADDSPVKGVNVSASGVGAQVSETIAITDETGKYEVLVAPNCIYMLIVKDQQWASEAQQGFAVYPNSPVEGKDFKLRKATRIFGTVRSGFFWRDPLPNHRVVISQLGKSLSDLPNIHLPDPEPPRRLQPSVYPTNQFVVWTDAKGNFEVYVGDGDFMRVSDGNGPRFKISGEESHEMNFEVNAKVPGLLAPTNAPLLGLIVEEGSQQPIRDCSLTIVPRAPSPYDLNSRPAWDATTGVDGKFRAERIRVGSFAYAMSSDKKLAGIIEVKDTKNVFVMKLRPVGSAIGRMLSPDGSKPVANQTLLCFFVAPFDDEVHTNRNHPIGRHCFLESCTTDEKGNFRFEHLAPNVDYHVYFPSSRSVFSKPLSTIKVTPGEEVDLGDLRSR